MLSEKYGVFVLEDAAHSLEAIAKTNFRKNYAVAFSFYANKNITTGGEGGAIATSDASLADTVRKLSLHGMSKDGWNRFKLGKNWRYDVSALGYKYNMNDISASFGLGQISNIDKWHNIRVNISKKYSKELKKCEGIICPSDKVKNHSWHLYIIKIIENKWKISGDELIYHLNENGVGTSVHYIPVHMHSYYQKKYGFSDNDFPNSKNFSETVISLPLYPSLKIVEVRYIIDTIIDLWNKFQK